MSDAVKMHVSIRGLKELQKEMTSVAPDLKNQLTKTYRDIAKEIVAKAKGRMPTEPPMRGWRTIPAKKPKKAGRGWVPWDGARAQAGVLWKAGVTDNNGKRGGFGYRVINASPMGAIAETAGRTSSGKQGLSNNPDAGRQFIQNLSWYGTPGRFIWKVYDQMQGEILTRTSSEVQRIASEYEARINSFGGD